MREYRIVWRQCPTTQHAGRVLFVKAANPKDAQAIAVNHIERTFAIDWFRVLEVTEAKPVPAGEVL